MSDGATALLLEDNRQMQHLMTVILREFGFKRVICAKTILEAQSIAEASTLELVLTDQLLQSGRSGLDFVRWLRQSDNDNINTLPVITVSSYSETSRIIEAINAGVDEFLVKPLKPQDLFNRIRMVSKKRRPFVRTNDYFGPCRRRLNVSDYKGPYRRYDDEQNEGGSGVIEL